MTERSFQERLAELHRYIDQFYASEPLGAAVVVMRIDADGTTVWRMVSEGAHPLFLETLQRMIDDESGVALPEHKITRGQLQ